MSFLDKLKATFGKAKDKSDAIVDKNRERIPDKVERVYDKVSDAAEKVAPGADKPATPAPSRPTTPLRHVPRHPPHRPTPIHEFRPVGRRSHEIGGVGQPLARMSSPSASSGRPGQRRTPGRRRQPGDEALHRRVADVDDRARAPRRAGRRRCRPCPSPDRPRRRPRRARRRPRPGYGSRTTCSSALRARRGARPGRRRRRTARRRRRRAAPAPGRDAVAAASTPPPTARRALVGARAARSTGCREPRRGCCSPVSAYRRDERPHQLEHRLEQVDVDDLTDARVRARPSWRTRRRAR